MPLTICNINVRRKGQRKDNIRERSTVQAYSYSMKFKVQNQDKLEYKYWQDFQQCLHICIIIKLHLYKFKKIIHKTARTFVHDTSSIHTLKDKQLATHLQYMGWARCIHAPPPLLIQYKLEQHHNVGHKYI